MVSTILSNKRTFGGVVLILLGIFILLTKMIQMTGTAPMNEKLLLISGFGESIPDQPQHEVTLSYSGTIENHTHQSLTIQSVEPILSVEAANLQIHPEKQILIYDRVLKKRESLHVNGEFLLDTSQLTEEEMNKILPGVIAYKITYNQDQEVVLNTVP
ncbi:hypothetical protein QPK24_17045 [Paenibacillus polygoni]|uniref:Uncharacterized protein n=1 Tax=Paenibacillus polygoni TaxID=3050112 RepID=A0ABY8WZC7_9BACL|nr:hypothetical protein [Paenibacillus polygoni]WIV18103.1 hypothetical protein QPK24_17045 [Paenibacillus polygoni]